MSLRKLAFALGALLFLLADSPRSRGDATREAANPDERLLQEAHVGTDNASLLTFLRKNTASDADLLSLDSLIRQLGSSQFRAREEASQKLTALGAAALVRLNRALTDPDIEIVRRATACLLAIGRRVNTDLPLAVVRRLVQRQPPGTLKALLRYLPSAPGEEAVEEIVYGLYGLAAPDGKVHPALVSALKDPLATRRAAAACIVGRLGNPAQCEAVRSLLADADPMVRLRAAQGLLAAKDRTSIPALVALLEEPAVEVSWPAEELLHWVAGEDAPEVTVGAAAAVARQHCREAWEGWWRKHGAQLDLAKVDEDHRRPGLVLTISHAAALALRDLGPRAREAVPTLAVALKARDTILRGLAMGALGQIGPEAKVAVPDLLAVLNKRGTDDPGASLHLRGCAVWALGQIGPQAKEANPALIRTLRDKALPGDLRKGAAEALGKIGTPISVVTPILAEFLKDEDELVREAAAAALKRIRSGK
jgi:HEAT repeat protein